jgi:signal transduction histidine kinase
MNTSFLVTRTLAPVWRHLRHAEWPLPPLAFVALLCGVRVLGAQSYAYWNDWLTYFTALLAAYCLVACARIILQSVCFDNAIACWIALFAAVGLGWSPSMLIAYKLSYMGVPTATLHLPMFVALLAAALLVVPAEVKAERARWTRRADEIQARRDREQRMERQLIEARLTALQGQIEPHFLYNTLANARALIRQDASAAEQLLQHLIHFLRSAMPDLRAHSTTLGQELDRARAYLDIIGMRMGERLRFDISAGEEARACQIPPLSVMTLVENAIQHGIEPRVAGGSVHINAVCSDGRLRIDVLDDGVGFEAESGDGVGLVNLQERLATLYGDDAELRLEPGAGGGVRASIELPMRSGGKA